MRSLVFRYSYAVALLSFIVLRKAQVKQIFYFSQHQNGYSYMCSHWLLLFKNLEIATHQVMIEEEHRTSEQCCHFPI